jgi:hypothetical protein
MRLLSEQLGQSLFSAVGQIEEARNALVSGSKVADSLVRGITAHLKQAEQGDLADNRDWEVLQGLGGNLPPIQDLVQFGTDVSSQWVKAWGGLVVSLAGFEAGLKLDIGDVSADGVSAQYSSNAELIRQLLATEGAFLNGFSKLGRWLDEAKQSEGAEAPEGVFDGEYRRLRNDGSLISSPDRAPRTGKERDEVVQSVRPVSPDRGE